ncbi:hypothetical protein Rhe02_43350 [Rhizocola hellebori]|uniref:Uncharacterized protein n=1 Tax=Rhizocola hellebori TaxID=1392758 RepID=A0A8J3VHT7_9ACTN|nr:hypothetical protein [Rhizocola hellebori]GIH06268.1 hypothetical protein Rhe02_43350 [Rhizocola hellebori]
MNPNTRTFRTAAVTAAIAALVLCFPLALLIVAGLLLHRWTGGRALSTMDFPDRLLTAAVATLPDRRRDWGVAMIAELAGIEGRRARWQFASSSAAAALWLAPIGRWPVLAPVTAVVVAGGVTAGWATGAAVPGLGVFAASFAGIIGVMVMLAIAYSRRVRMPAPVATLLLGGAVAAAVTMTVTFMVRQPTAAEHLSIFGGIFLAAVLAGGLWIAVAAPRTNRLAPYLGIGVALVYAAGYLTLLRAGYHPQLEPGTQQTMQLLAIMWLVSGSAIVFPLASFAAASAGRSFRSGVYVGVWAISTSAALAYAVFLYEALRRYTIRPGLLLDGEPGPVGQNLGNALFWVLGAIIVIGLPSALVGAGLGALTRGQKAHVVPDAAPRWAE